MCQTDNFPPCKIKNKARLSTLISGTQHSPRSGLFSPFNSTAEYLSTVFYMVKLGIICFFLPFSFSLGNIFPGRCPQLQSGLVALWTRCPAIS